MCDFLSPETLNLPLTLPPHKRISRKPIIDYPRAWA